VKHNSHRLAGRRGGLSLLVVVVIAAISALGVASPALAAPKGAFAVFSNCPLTISEGCQWSKTESGKFVIGKQTVPITNPIYLESGFVENPVTEQEVLIGAANGKTLSHSPQNVPGGLLDFVNCKEISNFFERVACELVFENGTTGVNATAELAGKPAPIELNLGNLFNETGTVFTMPVKIHLENPLLGSECYIGSETAPIDIALTTGTTSPPAPNKAIKGSAGTVGFAEEGKINEIKGVSLVNNTFAAPGANGCGGSIESLILDPIINAKLGLPATSGHNTSVLTGTIEQTAARFVKESE
jgi:hypothetical protein